MTIPIRHRADYRALAFLALLLSLYAIQYSGVLRHAGLLVLTCIFSFVAFIVRHNHIHCPLFTSRSWNRGLDLSLSLLTAQATDGVVAIHNERHHGRNHSEEDCVRSTQVRAKRNWLNLASFFFVAAANARIKKARDVCRWKTEQPARFQRYCLERAAVLLLLAALLIADWKSALIYVGVPLLAGHWCIVTINLLQHQDCDPGSEYNHSRNITGEWINWLFLNNGFHTAHHLRPRLHWSLLPEYHRKVVEPNADPSLHSNSLALAIWRQFFAPGRK